MKKAILIGAGILLIILSVIPVLFYVYKDSIRLEAERQIDRHINGGVFFENIDISFLKDWPNLTLTFKDVVLKGEGTFAEDTLAVVEEADVEVRTWSLIFGKEIEIKSAHLKQPVLHLETLKSGASNYLNLFAKPRPEAGDTIAVINIALDRISLEDGNIYYANHAGKLFMEMKGVTYSGHGDFEQNIFDLETKVEIRDFTLDQGAIRYLSQKQVWMDMLLELNLQKNTFTIKDNHVQINHFKFGIDGSLALVSNGYDVDVTFDTQETSFKNILSLVPGIYMNDFKQIKTAGELSFNGFIKGRYSQTSVPKFMANIKVSDAMFRIDTLPAGVEHIQLELMVKNNYGISDSTVIDFKKFHLDMLGHPIHGKIKIKGYPHYVVDADILADLDLADLEKMYPIRGLDLQGKLKAELKTHGQYIPSLYHDTLHSLKPRQIPHFSLNLTLQDGKIKYDHLPTPVENIQLSFSAENTTGDSENTSVNIQDLSMDLGKNPVRGNIKVAGFENYTVDADIKATIDLSDLEKMYPIEGTDMKGVLDMDVVARGVYDQTLKKFPVVDANISLTNGYLKFRDTPEPLENVHLVAEAINKTGRLRDTQFNIERLTYTLENEPFEVSGSVSDLENYKYDLKIKGRVDLEKITAIYPIKGVRVKGLIDSNIETRGQLSDIESGRYDKTESQGTIEVKDFEYRGKAMPAPIRIQDALFTITPARIVLEKFQGKFGKSNVSLKGDLTDYMAFITKKNDLITGDLNATCDTLDLNEWYRPGSDSAGVWAQKGRTSTSGLTAWAVPSNINFVFDSEIDHVIYQDMKISKLKGEIRIEDGTLTLHETGFNSLDAQFNLTGDYNTRDIRHPLFDFDLDIKALDIAKAYKEIKLVRDLAPAANNTFGQLSLSYKLQGELQDNMYPKTETLEGGGEIRIANARINGMKIFEELNKTIKKQNINDPHLKDFVMQTEIRNNKIFVKPFSIKLSGLNTDIEGVSDIGGPINYIVRIELLPIEKLRIPFHVTGTYDKPKVAIGKGHTLPQ
jgi:AsmA protein